MLKVDKNIYDVYLVSVSENAKVDSSDSVSHNISRAIMDNEISLLTRILVKKMPSDDYFREFITGKIIPGCISFTDWQYYFTSKQKLSNYFINDYAFIKPLYVKIPFVYMGYRDDIYDRFLVKALPDRVDEYIKKNVDVMEYVDKLDNLFEEAQRRYEKASSNYAKYKGYKYRKLDRGK